MFSHRTAGGINKKKNSLPDIRNPLKRSPGRTALRAVLTVEASVAVPVFLILLTALAGMLNIFGTRARHTVYLQEQAEAAGLSAASEIMLSESAECTIPGIPEIWGTVSIPCRGYVLSYLPEADTDLLLCASAKDASAERLVYVTEYGTVYHTTSRCPHLSLSISAVQADHLAEYRNSSGHIYYGCEHCAGISGASDIVYITKYGDRWHTSLSCPKLKRSISLVPLSEAAGLPECSKCASLREHY